MSPATDRPVIILGMMRRSGTNYLWNLLAAHPDLSPSPVVEDHLLEEAALLSAYAERTARRWSPAWSPEAPDARLLAALGGGLLSLMAEGREQPGRLLLKTPSAAQAEALWRLAPSAKLLVVVRDGRDVVTSGMRSFGWSFEAATLRWAREARRVRDLLERHPARTKLVHFEALAQQPRETIRQLLPHLELQPTPAFTEAMDAVPVKGSSTLRQTGALHWSAVPRTADFQPVGRWQAWPAWRKRWFQALAGRELAGLGYAADRAGRTGRASGLRASPARAAADGCLDALLAARRWAAGARP